MWYANLNNRICTMVQEFETVINTPSWVALPTAQTEAEAQTFIGKKWNAGAWEEYNPPVNYGDFLPLIGFYRLFTLQIQAAIQDSADPIVKAFLDRLLAAEGCYLAHPETIQGINYLVQAGLLTQPQADSILDGIPITV